MPRLITTVAVYMSRFDFRELMPENRNMVLEFRFDETCRTFIGGQSARRRPKSSTTLPTITSRYFFALADFLSDDDDSSSDDDDHVDYNLFPPNLGSSFNEVESIIASVAYTEARRAASMGEEALGVKADVRVYTDCFEPAEFCNTCWKDLELNDKKNRTPCGHLHHEECVAGLYQRHGCRGCGEGYPKPSTEVLDLVKINFDGELFLDCDDEVVHFNEDYNGDDWPWDEVDGDSDEGSTEDCDEISDEGSNEDYDEISDEACNEDSDGVVTESCDEDSNEECDEDSNENSDEDCDEDSDGVVTDREEESDENSDEACDEDFSGLVTDCEEESDEDSVEVVDEESGEVVNEVSYDIVDDCIRFLVDEEFW